VELTLQGQSELVEVCEFGKSVNQVLQRSSKTVDLPPALAHLGVARANILKSRTLQGADADAARVRALATYKDFLTLWKVAGPDIPILKEAKAEYAKLH
jgi:hypothetical protein